MARVTSIRLSDELVERLDELATSLDRPRSWLIEQAITRYVEEEAEQVAAVSQALNDYRDGRATIRHHEDVMARMDAKIRAVEGDADPLA
jgi:predicted transcriptional regulator